VISSSAGAPSPYDDPRQGEKEFDFPAGLIVKPYKDAPRESIAVGKDNNDLKRSPSQRR
jgi:hypothetical protein